MNGYNQYLRDPSGSLVYIGPPGMGREVAGRWSGRVAQFSRRGMMKGGRDGALEMEKKG